MNEVQIFPFLNAFVAERRLELVVDWLDKWPAMDPFTGVDFRLALTDPPAEGGPPPPPPPTTASYPYTLDHPILPAEVREQLMVVSHDAKSGKEQVDNVRWLAPHFVAEAVATISTSTPTDCSSTGTTRANIAETRATVAKDHTRVQLFSSPHLMADLERWATPRASRSAVALQSETQGEAEVFGALSRLIEGVNGSKGRARSALLSGRDQELHTKINYTLNTVVSDRDAFRNLLEDAQRSPDLMEPIVDLERAIRNRSIENLLIYAEALRRDQVYSRLRSEQAPEMYRAMTAPLDTKDPRTICAHRADVRRLSRDEPVLGAMFHVLRWFALPANAKDWAGRLIWVRPFRDQVPLDGFKAMPTLVALAADLPVTVLRRDLRPSYFAQSLTVRQIAPALLLDGEDEDEEGRPRDPLARLRRMLDSGQSCPPITHKLVTGGDPSGRNGDDSGALPHAAFQLNNDAHRPDPGSKAHSYIFDDAKRELADAAESVRCNVPPFDTIGITWERAATEQAVFGENATSFLTGFKGYRIDVRGQEEGDSWNSLCTVERELFDRRQQAVVRSRLPRESYVVQPVQNHSEMKSGDPTVLTLPADFVYWAGGSVVVASPLDRLGESLAPPTDDGPLLTLRELGKTGISPRYGRRYEFRVRGVGLSGSGPGIDFRGDDGAHDSIDFRRGVPMDAPKGKPTYVDLLPLDDQGRSISMEPDKLTPDVPLLATSTSARLLVHTAPPLAHWRVALHARGLTRQEQTANGGTEFERACARFRTRVRENWRRRIAGVPAPGEVKPAAHLSALDPHCTAIELVTRAWFPFSSNPDDRYIVTGRQVQRRQDIKCASFTELVIRGEDLIETELLDGEFEVRLDRSSLPAAASPDSPPRLLAGFHGTAELVGQWSEDAARHFRSDDGRKRWTRNLFVGVEERRKIGGSGRPLEVVFKAGGPALAADTHFVDAAYAALEQPKRERDLRMPPSPQPAGPDCETSVQPPTLASPAYWRKKLFDRDCITYPPGDDCQTKRQEYRQFVAQQVGPAELASKTETDYDQKGYDNRVIIRLVPTMVPLAQRARSLVLPVFTFPLETTYDPAVVLPGHGGARSVTAKLGDFGSGGVVRIDVTAKGSGYTMADKPNVLVDAASEGEGAPVAEARVSGIDSTHHTLERIEVLQPGRDYTKAPKVRLEGGAGSGAVAAAELGLVGRRLPWVDVDIVWSIRLGWRVPLSGGPLERPLELAAVREFQLFRKDLRPAPCDPSMPPEAEKPLATLARPGVDTLQKVDLDLVEFTWVDAITDREAHQFEYKVVAVPEDRHTFASQIWFNFRVDVPDSRIAPRPESMRFLPMLAKQQGGHTTRNLALYFSDSTVRRRADHVTLRFARAADDPMLPIEPKVEVDTTPAPFIPSSWKELFPPARGTVEVVADWKEIAADPGKLEGAVAPLIDCDPPSEDRRTRLFVIRSSAEDGTPLIWPKAPGELGNPFFKLHLFSYDERRLPALAHTAASEPAESDWLQFYPDDLDLQWVPEENVLKIASPWGTGSADAKNFVWYRFHFFAEATRELLFHVSTFYSHGPSLALDGPRRTALAKSFERFGGHRPGKLKVSIRAEEGLLAETYAVDDTSGRPVAVSDEVGRFVVLRSTSALKDLVIEP
ncbi:MAG TPA: hypothetical protein VH988_08415 [Thermoanaerobaculia bacterium]|jgi:hypothetical protein|nr:hypothetical protein [Thermoanaerobaculia bacterium]